MTNLFKTIQNLKEKRHPYCTMVVPAAGNSSRMGGGNKLLMNLMGSTVLERTLFSINECSLVDEIIVATNRDSMEAIAKICSNPIFLKPIKVIIGGATRAESVALACAEVNSKCDFIGVHDAARPLITPDEIDDIVRTAYKTNAVAPALPVTDTIKVVNQNGFVKSTPNRNELFAVQTPQVFQTNILKAALQNVIQNSLEVTDDCSAVEMIGKEIYLTEGSRYNIKITTPIDFVIATALLKERYGG